MLSKATISKEVPVILGGGLTGLLISKSLSRQQIDHVLIGQGPPDDRPRLGESCNEGTSFDMLHWLSDLNIDEYLYTKSHISLLTGRSASMIYIADPTRNLATVRSYPLIQRLLFSFSCLSHVDRIGFDKALYQRVIKSRYCRYETALVTDVNYDPGSDRIQSVTLDNGLVIEQPCFVFDATKNLLAQATQVETRWLSDDNRLVWTHLQRDTTDRSHWWHGGTNLMRTNPPQDNFEGLSWVIPLGQILSVGISVNAARHNMAKYSTSQLMELTLAAYRRRGIDIDNDRVDIKPLQEIQQRYFVRNRAYGANWLLAGGAFIQIWFPSSAGIWTSLVAAHLAPKLITHPRRYGQLYESELRLLLNFHEQLDALANGPVMEQPIELYHFWSRWLAGVPRRFMFHRNLVYDQPLARLNLQFADWQTAIATSHILPLQILLTMGMFSIRVMQLDAQNQPNPSMEHYKQFVQFGINNALHCPPQLLTSWLDNCQLFQQWPK